MRYESGAEEPEALTGDQMYYERCEREDAERQEREYYEQLEDEYNTALEIEYIRKLLMSCCP